MSAIPAEERRRITELRRSTLQQKAPSVSRRNTRQEPSPRSPAQGWGRVVAVVAAALSVAAAWLGSPGLVFHVSSSLREWLMPLVQ